MSKQEASKICVGISGWTYPDWRGTFYPPKWAIKRELEYASRAFNSIEVNGTFYAMQKPHTFEKWYQETPEGFTFALKAPKYITHQRRLKDVATPIANFFASGVLALKEKLGPILWQLPPSLPYNRERIEEFLKLLPHTNTEAAKIAEGHSDWMSERAYLTCDQTRPLVHALEVRHDSFENEEFIKMMKDHGIAIVVGDTAGRWPFFLEKTGPAMYIRLHGDEAVFPEGYTSDALSAWAQKISELSSKAESVYAFCDNDHKTAAPMNAKELMEILALHWQPSPDAMLTKTPRVRATKSKPLSKKRKTG